jgi:hypothetical protein
MEKRALRTDDIEPPSRPILDVRADFVAQFGDGKESLILGALQVMDFDPCIVDDLFMIVHKVKEAAHFGAVAPRNRMESASVFYPRSEETFSLELLFVSGRSLSHGVKTVQRNPANVRPRHRHEIGAPVLEPLNSAGNRPLVTGRTIDHDCPYMDLIRINRNRARRRRRRFRGSRLGLAAVSGPQPVESRDSQSRPVTVTLAYRSQEGAARAPRIPRGSPGLCQLLSNGFNLFVCHVRPQTSYATLRTMA